MKQISIAALCLCLFFILIPSQAQESQISPGCAEWDNLVNSGSYFYFAGDLIGLVMFENNEGVVSMGLANLKGSQVYLDSVLDPILNQPYTFTYTVPSDGFYFFAARFGGGNIDVIDEYCVGVERTAEEAEAIPVADDGRLNAYDGASPVVIFYVEDAWHLYAIDPETSEGVFVGSISVADMEAAEAGILFEIEGLISLSKLSDGRYELRALQADGKWYVFQANTPYPNTGYTSWTE